MNPAILGLIAMVPMMVGSPPAQEKSIVAALCNGGTISIPLRDGGKRELPEPCQMKACHAGTCRKKFDLAQ